MHRRSGNGTVPPDGAGSRDEGHSRSGMTGRSGDARGERTTAMGDTSTYGHLAIAALVLVAAFGAPLPVASVLAAAGVLAAHGKMNIVTLITVASVAAVAGDGLGYVLGRFGLRWFAKR